MPELPSAYSNESNEKGHISKQWQDYQLIAMLCLYEKKGGGCTSCKRESQINPVVLHGLTNIFPKAQVARSNRAGQAKNFKQFKRIQ
jgi:hypothetical protein